MIHGPFSEEFFWYDESESDPEFKNHWDDPHSSPSNDDWGWDEWGDLVVFRPVCHESNYQYPLVLWISLDTVAGVTLKDWFPDLSDRNYLGAEVQLDASALPIQIADRVAIAIREMVSIYNIHPRRIWIAGVGLAATRVLQSLPMLSRFVRGAIAINPDSSGLHQAGNMPMPSLSAEGMVSQKTLYLATDTGHSPVLIESILENWDHPGGFFQHMQWESLDASRLAVCSDLNAWLMQQVCAPSRHPEVDCG